MTDVYRTATTPVVDDAGQVTMRIIPYGQVIDHYGTPVVYDRGSVHVDDRTVPLTVDHGYAVSNRIGKVTSVDDRADGLYATASISATSLGQDMRTLLVDGSVDEVSAGIDPAGEKEWTRDGVWHRVGVLDHVALVDRGAFGRSTPPSKVISAYSTTRGSSDMADQTPTPATPPAPPAPPPATPATPAPATPAPATPEHPGLPPAAAYATTAQVDDLARQVAALTVPAPKTPEDRPGDFRSIAEYARVQLAAAKGDQTAQTRMATYQAYADEQLAQYRRATAEYALADDTTTTSAGLVPDYLSTEIISLIDDFRPFIDAMMMTPIGDYGMSLDYPQVVTKPQVGKQATQNTEVATRAVDIDTLSVAIDTYAGANQIAMQLIDRSMPGFLDMYFAELAGVYAERTDAAAIAAAVAGKKAGQTAVVADFSTGAAATWAAFATAAGVIAGSIKRPMDLIVIASDRFAQLLKLVDSDGRPLIVPDDQGPQNAQGVGGFGTFRFRYGGLSVIVDPHAADGTCLCMWSGSVAIAEMMPQQVRMTQAGLLAVDAGVWGLFAPVVKYPGGLYTITAS